MKKQSIVLFASMVITVVSCFIEFSSMIMSSFLLMFLIFICTFFIDFDKYKKFSKAIYFFAILQAYISVVSAILDLNALNTTTIIMVFIPAIFLLLLTIYYFIQFAKEKSKER